MYIEVQSSMTLRQLVELLSHTQPLKLLQHEGYSELFDASKASNEAEMDMVRCIAA